VSLSEIYTTSDATALAELVRRREVTPLELVEAAITAIEAVNPAINAVVTPLYEAARETARAPLAEGPFAGVPFLVKDLVATLAGAPMTGGCRLSSRYLPDYDSELVRRLKQAGLIILGKTNTPEFGMLPTTEPHLFGPTRNPWDTSRIAGGSSGGSAAAVAAGLVPMAHGNDGGGSIRIPASCCGVFGLKPTRARNSLAPDFGDTISGFVVEHVLSRSVRDSAALLDATQGPAPGDPYHAPPSHRPFAEEPGRDPGRLRIAVSHRPLSGLPVHGDCIEALDATVRLCAELGHEVEEAAPEVDGEQITECFLAAWSATGAAAIRGLCRALDRAPSAEDFEPLTWHLYRLGSELSAADHLLAHGVLRSFARKVAEFFADWDIWLTPTVSQPPLPLGAFNGRTTSPAQGLEQAVRFVTFTPIANITGQPAMSVPLHWSADRLPIGSHFIGRFGAEATLFRLAAQLESARPWANHRPPLHAGFS
jgi:amidase